ncbi:MAG: GNAT family N-acetyltransferase [Bacteroidales bacterium]
MKIRVTIIDNKAIERLIRSSNSINSNNIGFLAYVNDMIAGFSMLKVENEIATIEVLNVYNEFRRCGIGKQMLSEIVKYSGLKNLKLYAKFKAGRYDVKNIKDFYFSQGYADSQLDDTEYSINLEDWHSIFNPEYRKNEYCSFKLYPELADREKQDIAKICLNNLSDKKYLCPNCYKEERDNNSLYIVDQNGELYGWSIAKISDKVLYIYCVYILPEYRHLGAWLSLLQYMSSESYLKQCSHEIHTVNFRVGSDNKTMNKFIKILLKEIDHTPTDHYIITLIKS